MKKLVLFLTLLLLSASSFAQIKDPCPSEKKLEDKAECLKEVATGIRNDNTRAEAGLGISAAPDALTLLKDLFDKNPVLEKSLTKKWITKVVESMVNQPSALKNRLQFYLDDLGANPDFEYKYAGQGYLDAESGDYLIHAAIRTINEESSDKVEASTAGMQTLINHANVCVKDADGEKAFSILKSDEKNKKIAGFLAARKIALKNCI